MKLPIGIANKLLQMLQGERLSASTLQHAVVTKMLEDGVIQKQQTGKTKAFLFIANPTSLHVYISNYFGINNLLEYVSRYYDEGLTRAGSIAISGNSKLRSVRTFKGFLINSYQDINATIRTEPFTIHPVEGTFTYITDFETLKVPGNITIIGIENPENFSYIRKQQYLFSQIQPLFVSRYPQSNDLVKWLKSIPNSYLHFGDFDFSGISIYLNEYKKYLGEKASFFIPTNIDDLIEEHGNRDLYNKQLPYSNSNIDDPNLLHLMSLLHKYKKVLEQEVLIK